MWDVVTLVITIFLVLAVGLILWAYLAGERRAGMRGELTRLSGRECIRCHICGHVYEAVPIDGLSRCSLCNSYNRSGGEAGSSPEDTAQPKSNQEGTESEKTS